MDYQRIYNQLIDRARKENRVYGKGTYYERHHIIPRCMGGEGKATQWKTHLNIIVLTAREHFLAHRLLFKIHPENTKIAYSFWAMCNLKNAGQEGRYFPNSRAYREAKEAHSKAQSISRTAFYKTPKGIESKLRAISKIDQGARVANTDYAARTAKTDLITKAANTDYATIGRKHMKQIAQFNKDGSLIKEWPSVKEAAETLEIIREGISNCLTGRCKYSGGFIWKYSN